MFFKGVKKDAPLDQIRDPEIKFDNPDTWYIYLAVGNMDKFFDIEPYPLEWVAFDKQGNLKYYEFEHIKEAVCSGTPIG